MQTKRKEPPDGDSFSQYIMYATYLFLEIA